MFGKKKKKDAATDSDASVNAKATEKNATKGKDSDTTSAPEPGVSNKKKSRFSIKKVLFILLLLLAVAIAGFVVYRIYFQKVDPDSGYRQQELVNITLPEEIIQFSHDFMPLLYDSLITFNSEVLLLEKEIERITALAEQYPDQKKIADKEIKIWKKEKDKLKKAYEKLETKVEALYVSYRVNKETGFQLIDEQNSELTQSAQDALTGSMALTARLKLVIPEQIPEGFVQGNLYKVKKKIADLTN